MCGNELYNIPGAPVASMFVYWPVIAPTEISSSWKSSGCRRYL